MNNKILKTIIKIVIYLLMLIIFIGTLLLIYRQVYRSKVLRENKITTINGIDEEFTAEINGINQYFYARGENKENPIILFIHGGPGSPITPMIYTYQKGLENDYTVVNWDQRNAGKTYFLNKGNADKITASLSIDQSVSDIFEVVTMLKDKYDKEVIIMGHSWGSTIGTIFVNKYPEMVKAYVGIGQNISINDGEKLIAEETLKVIDGKDKKEYLNIIDNKDTITFGSEEFNNENFAKHRGISGKYLMPGVIKDSSIAKIVLLSPYYSLGDITWFLKNNLELQRKLLDELGSMDLREENNDFKVPMIFISGDKDWVTPYPIVEEYYNLINAPYKKMIFIEDAGHSPMMDNPKAFCNEVINVLKELD